MLRLGDEMGLPFSLGLCNAANLPRTHLDVRAKLGEWAGLAI